MKLKMLFFSAFWLMLFFHIAQASIVEINPSILNASWDVILNISVNNTETVNISRVSVFIPSGFEIIGGIGTSVNISLVENPTRSNPLIWFNKSIEGIVGSESIEYFWFRVRAPSVASGSKFTFLVNLTYLNSSEEYHEINLTIIDADAPIFLDISFSRQNNTKYSPGAKYGFQIRWKDNVNISTVIFSSNFNDSINLTVSLFSGNEREGTYVVNFTDLSAGTYWFIWYAEDTSGNWNGTSNITYVILPADNIVTSYVNGIPTSYAVFENGTNVNITVIANGVIYLFKNGTELVSNRNVLSWNEILDVGIYEYKANVSTDNVNYTSNATGATFFVKIIYPRIRFKDLQFPTSTTYSPNAIYTFKVTFFSLAYPLNNITNVSFIFDNKVHYLPVNNPKEETYSFAVRDLAAGTYSWRFCANDTQGESNCTSGILTISQAIPKLDIINVQDYVAPVNKTIIGVGCPSQLICKLYLNDTELPDNFYDLSTAKGGYYIFTFNTSGNVNYSTASVTKAMTVYSPRQIETTTNNTTIITNNKTQENVTFGTLNVKNLRANVPEKFKIENSDLLKVTEVEITAIENVENVEVKVGIPLPNEISVSFVEKNKVFLTYIKITTNISTEKIASIKIKFKVEKSWIEANNIDASRVFLYKLVDGKWVQLSTRKLGENETDVYYESTLNSLSIFVIAGEIKKKFPWHLVLIPIVIIIAIVITYIFWPTSIGNEYDKLKQKWASGDLRKQLFPYFFYTFPEILFKIFG